MNPSAPSQNSQHPRFCSVLAGAALAACVFLASPALAARLALVIGNDAYTQIPALRNAAADARAIAATLEAAGFRVTLALDQNRNDMTGALRRFKTSLSGGDEVVLFYAGHGVQFGGSNFLLPTDIGTGEDDQVRDDAVSLQRILEDLAEQKTRFSLAIIDACRDNPMGGKGRSTGTRGLAPTSPASGQMIIFSAGAGQQALDRLGEQDRSPNGVFTRVLLGELQKGGQPVDRALKKVRGEVVRLAKSVGHEQTPAIYDQSVGDFFLAGPPRRIDVPALLARAKLAFAAGRADELIRLSDEVLAQQPGETTALANLAIGYLMAGRHQEAIEAADRVLAIDARHAGAYNNRGAAEERVGRTDAALADYRRGCDLQHALSCRNAERLDKAAR